MTMPPTTTPPPNLLCEPDVIAAAYAGTRRRTTELLRAADAGVGDRLVPACPEWTVAELVAHMCGVCVDVLAGNIAGAGTDPWTAAQVEAFVGTPLPAILDRWDEVGPQVEVLLPAVPAQSTSQMVFDLTTHEHDLRGALDQPGGRDADAIRVGLGFLLTAIDGLIREHGLDGLEVTTGDEVLMVGDGDPRVQLNAAPFELFRALGGRRTLDEVRALDWSADPAPYLDRLFGGPLRPPTASLAE